MLEGVCKHMTGPTARKDARLDERAMEAALEAGAGEQERNEARAVFRLLAKGGKVLTRDMLERVLDDPEESEALALGLRSLQVRAMVEGAIQRKDLACRKERAESPDERRRRIAAAAAARAVSAREKGWRTPGVRTVEQHWDEGVRSSTTAATPPPKPSPPPQRRAASARQHARTPVYPERSPATATARPRRAHSVTPKARRTPALARTLRAFASPSSSAGSPDAAAHWPDSPDSVLPTLLEYGTPPPAARAKLPRDGKRGALPSPGQSFTPLPAGVPLALAARVGIVA